MKKWYAVIGDPIAQSMSSSMHNQWFVEHKIDATYIPLLVKEKYLEQTIKSLQLLGCSGFNVTVPHKQAILPFLDQIDESAMTMNAVNTVQLTEEGSLIGHNTDGMGFVRSLEEEYKNELQNANILVIGAGGAAIGIAISLEKAGYGPITITNRTSENGQKLARQLKKAEFLSFKEAEKSLNQFQLIIQATSVGMSYAQSGLPIQLEYLRKDAVVVDIIYNPLETEFLEAARQKGARTLNGVAMFVHQGAQAFQTWTGIQPNTENMIEKVTQNLGGTYVNR